MIDIFKNHKLISDSTGYLHDTPREVYRELQKWLGESFPKNYEEFIGQIAKQFSKEYGREFEGYELMGGIGGRSGNAFFVHDLAIVDLVLTPVLSGFAKTADGWKWIKSNVLDRNVSAECPTFAKRATVPLLLERLRKEKTEEETKAYLVDLIQMRKGIPSSNEIIFDKLRSEVEGLPVDILLELIQKDLDSTDDKIPTNVFVVILLFELIKRGNNEAEKLLFSFLDKEEYLKWNDWRYHTLDHFHIIANRRDVQKKIFDKLFEKESWAKKMEEDAFTRGDAQQAFTSWATIEAKARIARERNLEFLNDEFREKGLKSSLVVKALPEVAKEYPEEVLQLLKGGILTKNVQNEISDPYAREQITRVALVLAEKQREYHDQNELRERFAKGALWILDHFMNDSDPKPFKSELYDGDPEFDYDQKIRNGEDANVITSVRGNIAWVLHQLANYEPILPEVYEKTKALLEDENWYVLQQALIPLSLITANRRMLSEEQQADLHQLLFNLLEEYSGNRPLANYLLQIFGNYRKLNEEEAKIVLEKLGDIDESAALFIYFAIYRKEYDKEFKSGDFGVLLKEKINTGDKNLRRKIAWHFWRIVDDDISQVENLKQYITTLSNSKYDRQVFGNLDQLIEIVIKEKEYAELAIKWFESSLNGRAAWIDEMVEKDKNFGDWMQYEEIFEGIVKWQPDKFLPILEKTIEIAETGQVHFYDVKKCFEASRNNSELDKEKGKLDKLWERVKKVYPRADDHWHD